ncbi:cysteine--tRNA ligase [endosymbiont of Pachyrhynchus infernalis]|uniref:cysteine--tRNA ligase n=1 Tax=endosymbiont of Pachyrhynchus infernalis TaxID=1971488 RepID=UPI000DC70A45|nr:cysteine--tRNA ligase [endosymbiont of Pachyrhynchus infernalis]BBA84924.1 cysteine--tRNA ligase [endosymbiont of Pachyrhynchus infernalis]
MILFNTYSKKKEKIISKNINIYVCGITVYSYCHIGHARTFIIFDILLKFLKNLGYEINYVRNITDIDNKIIEESNKNNIDYKNLTNNFIHNMNNDFKSLNLNKPTHEPKVTECISEIINLIEILIIKKHVYRSLNGDLLFSIKSFKDYGKLSNRFKDINFNNNISNEYSDFVVWKLNSKYPNWNSPWGKGRPGWHIECSAISNKFFKNKTINIHGGGYDLLFPHHENELAQSYSGFDDFNIKIWMHIGSVIFFNEKMSKSLNNSFLIRNILKYFNPEVLKFFLISKHYRNPINYNSDNLKKSYFLLKKLYTSINNFKIIKKENYNYKTEFTYRFNEAMNNDLNIPKAYSILFEISNEINKFKNLNNTITNNLIIEMINLGNILGILQYDSNTFLKTKNNINNILELEILTLINKRNIARKNKDWNTADNIRFILNKRGIILEDNINKTIWKKKYPG